MTGNLTGAQGCCCPVYRGGNYEIAAWELLVSPTSEGVDVAEGACTSGSAEAWGGVEGWEGVGALAVGWLAGAGFVEWEGPVEASVMSG